MIQNKTTFIIAKKRKQKRYENYDSEKQKTNNECGDLKLGQSLKCT